MKIPKEFEATWAGYDSSGNDCLGHMHIHSKGKFIRSDGIMGFYCAAPLNFNGKCIDPPKQILGDEFVCVGLEIPGEIQRPTQKEINETYARSEDWQ